MTTLGQPPNELEPAPSIKILSIKLT